MSFSDLPVRENGKKIYASWFNDIRTALVAAFGVGGIPEAQFTIADNQSSYQDITGLLLDQNVARVVDVEYTIYRTNGSSTERRERGVLHCTYKAIAAVWDYNRETLSGDDALNVADSLICNSSGQIQYKSDSVGGTYVGKIRYKSGITFDKET